MRVQGAAACQGARGTCATRQLAPLLQGSSDCSLPYAPHHSFALAPGAARAMDTGVAVAPRLVLPSQEAFMQSPQSLMSEPDPLHLRVVKHPVSVGFVKMDVDAWEREPREQDDSMRVSVGGGGRRKRSSVRKRFHLPAITIKAPMPAGDHLPAHAHIRRHTLTHAHTRSHTCMHAWVFLVVPAVSVSVLPLYLRLWEALPAPMHVFSVPPCLCSPCLRVSVPLRLFKLELVSWGLDCICPCLCASTCVCVCGASLRSHGIK